MIFFQHCKSFLYSQVFQVLQTNWEACQFSHEAASSLDWIKRKTYLSAIPSFQSVEKFLISNSGMTALIHHNINFFGGTCWEELQMNDEGRTTLTIWSLIGNIIISRHQCNFLISVLGISK